MSRLILALLSVLLLSTVQSDRNTQRAQERNEEIRLYCLRLFVVKGDAPLISYAGAPPPAISELVL